MITNTRHKVSVVSAQNGVGVVRLYGVGFTHCPFHQPSKIAGPRGRCQMNYATRPNWHALLPTLEWGPRLLFLKGFEHIFLKNTIPFYSSQRPIFFIFFASVSFLI